MPVQVRYFLDRYYKTLYQEAIISLLTIYYSSCEGMTVIIYWLCVIMSSGIASIGSRNSTLTYTEYNFTQKFNERIIHKNKYQY